MMNFQRLLAVSVLSSLMLVTLSPAQAQEGKPAELRVFPQNVDLSSGRDRQSILVQAVYPNGLTKDVTESATFAFANAALVKQEGNTIYPVADGETELSISFEGLAANLPVKVANHDVDPAISFKLDVMPVFMKSSCNNGSCHGAARGKDGFRLSLFGFDPDGDYHRITREIPGRRINLAIPERSLLLEKGSGQVPHTGGKQFAAGSELYNITLRWLKEGALLDQGEVPKVDRIELYPSEAVLDGPGATQRLSVRAYYSDGTDRDVTSQALFLTSNETSAEIAQEGIVTAGARGESFIMARFSTHTVGSRFITLPKGLEFTWPEGIAEHNYIDQLNHVKLKKLRQIPSDICTDEEFLRRVTIDITGTMPTVEEYTRFMSEQAPNKRELKIDELLGRKEFVEVWVMKWAELLKIRSDNQNSYKAMLLYYNWLKDRVASNTPVNVMVQELLSANGGTFSNPPTNFYQLERDTLKTAENVAQVFMGMRIQCAQCHNHPFDRWTMDDYYSFAAFFPQIGRKSAEDIRELVVFNSGGGEVNHLVGNRPMTPKFLGGETPDVKGKDRREVVAKWLASDDNPYFARNLVNIVWAHFFGRGIINEVDDVRVSNPPVNEPLLNALAGKLTEYKYDFKQLVKDICMSRTYQLSTQVNETNEADNTNFSHALLRRHRAEFLLDSISQVTDTQDKFRGLPLGARAVQISDGSTSSYFLTTFGRASRETVCSCEVKMEPNLSQALHLLNGDTVNAKITQGGIVKKNLDAGKLPQDVLDELYIRCLCRRPTEAERTNLNEILLKEENQQQVLEDIFWALLNSREFLFNH
ncbi:MAG TPA: DUF1549 domain-containing protein [Planctomycetaceae bacterium]|nr:DUF1549 domain-containing protein [Planctomycetaceae bacterium]